MGAWIETYVGKVILYVGATSHPYMGAWIETAHLTCFSEPFSRTLTWVRGLKRLFVVSMRM